MYMRYSVTVFREQLETKQRETLKRPDDLLHASALKAELAKHDLDIRRIQSYVLTRNTIAEAVEAIEKEGAENNIEVTVSDINEVVELGAGGNVVEPVGPLRKIKLQVIGSGQPSNLLTFLYKIEHAPYLLYLDEWQVASGVRSGGQGVSTAAPDQSRGGQPVVEKATMGLSVIMFVHRNE
ncbi:MAG: hypothetical protein WD200_00045 [Candidatus Andersenbacteria bacterium]